jgi:hypothetical protein
MSIFGNMNYVKKMMRHPCATPSPQVMIESAFEAALPLLFVVNTFSCFDWYKASLGISWKCGRKLKEITKRVYGPVFSDGIHFMYQVSGLAAVESALWISFLADLAVDTGVNFASLMYLNSGCDLPNTGTIQGGLAALVLDPGQEGRMFLDTRDEKPCVLVGGNVIQAPSGCYVDISYTATWAPWPPGRAGGGSVTTWIADDVGNQLDISSGSPPNKNGETMTGGGINHLAGRYIAGMEYSIQHRSEGGMMYCVSGSFTASGHGKSVPLIGPGCFSHLGEPPREPQGPPAHPGPADPPRPHPHKKKPQMRSKKPPKVKSPVVKGRKPRKPKAPRGKD